MFNSARRGILAALALVILTAIGCQGGSKSSGKYSDLDKPKPVAERN